MAEPWEYIHTKRVLNKYGLPAGIFDPETPGRADIRHLLDEHSDEAREQVSRA